MKINLRKANALQLAVKQAIHNLPVETTVTISRFENPHEKFTKARAEHLENRDKKIALILAVYRLRDIVAVAGIQAGVSHSLTDMAAIDKMVEMIAPLAAIKEFAPEGDVFLAQFDDMKNEPHLANTYHGRRNEIVVSLITKKDDYEKILAESRRSKQQLSDELLEKNVQTVIELPEDLVQVFKAHGLL